MEALGAVIAPIGFLIVIAAGVALLLPLKRLKGKRSTVAKVLAGGFVVFVVGAIMSPPPPPEPAPTGQTPTKPGASDTAHVTAQAHKAPVAQAAAAASNPQLDKPEDVLAVIRSTAMQVTFCSGETDLMQSAIDRASAGKATAMQAYSAAHIAERDCRKMTAENAEANRSPFKSVSLNDIFSRTFPSCRSVALEGAKSASIAKDVLDNEGGLKRAQEYLDSRSEMRGKVLECNMGLQGLAEKAGIGKDEVDFLR